MLGSLNLRLRLWDSYRAVHLSGSYRLPVRPSFIARLGIAFCGALTLGILSAQAADAAALSKRHARVTRSSDDHSMRRRVHARATAQRSGRRSAQYLLQTQRVVRWHIPDRLERRQTAPFRDTDAAAIQSSGAAVSGADDLLELASLEPLGILALPPCRITINGAVTPRSPRGPPSFRA